MPGQHRRSVATEIFRDSGDIEVGWIGIVDGTGIAFFPVANQIAVQHTGPSDTALKKGELKCREPARHAAQKQRLADGLSSSGEMTNVVVDEIGVRNPCAKSLRRAVERRHYPQSQAFCPHWV